MSTPYNRVVYIYLTDDPDGLKHMQQQQGKYDALGIPFLAVGVGSADGQPVFPESFPDLDEHTKIIITGHANKESQHISTVSEGGGVQLGYQMIADQLAVKIKPGSPIRIALYSCYGGFGKSVTSHEDSVAGHLFAALIEKGLKPIISASLAIVVIRKDNNRLLRTIELDKKDPEKLEQYNDLMDSLRKVPVSQKEKLKKWKKVQEYRSNINDVKAQGSKVLLSYGESSAEQASSMQVAYPYGHPEIPFSKEKLHARGRTSYSLEEAYQRTLAPTLIEGKVRLKEIFDAIEMEYPIIIANKGYLTVKQFLLEEDYLFDPIAISEFIQNYVPRSIKDISAEVYKELQEENLEAWRDQNMAELSARSMEAWRDAYFKQNGNQNPEEQDEDVIKKWRDACLEEWRNKSLADLREERNSELMITHLKKLRDVFQELRQRIVNDEKLQLIQFDDKLFESLSFTYESTVFTYEPDRQDDCELKWQKYYLHYRQMAVNAINADADLQRVFPLLNRQEQDQFIFFSSRKLASIDWDANVNQYIDFYVYRMRMMNTGIFLVLQGNAGLSKEDFVQIHPDARNELAFLWGKKTHGHASPADEASIEACIKEVKQPKISIGNCASVQFWASADKSPAESPAVSDNVEKINTTVVVPISSI